MGRLVKKNTPAEVVVVLRSALVLRLVTVTVASGMIASLESVTVPEMVPVISWALRGKGQGSSGEPVQRARTARRGIL